MSPSQPADPPVASLHDRRIAVVGYGVQGTAQAQNLDESGLEVRVGVRPEGASAQRAREDDMETTSIPEAAAWADTVFLLVPDDVHGTVFDTHVRPNLDPGDALVVAHGFSLWARLVEPPEELDVLLLAPKAPGAKVRSAYRRDDALPALVGVHQDSTGQAWPAVRALAKAVGSPPGSQVETTVEEETVTDLFGEQAVLCGGLTELVTRGFETLVDAGYDPEIAYLEVVNELKLIVDLLHEGGIEHMWSGVSNLAEFGGRLEGSKIVDDSVQTNMHRLLEDIEEGRFLAAWREDRQQGFPRLAKARENSREHPIEVTGRHARKRLSIRPEHEAPQPDSEPSAGDRR